MNPMLVLGVSWLVLAPVCLWLLVRGRARARVSALLALVALEAVTVRLGAAGREPAAPAAPPAAGGSPAPMASPGPAVPPASPGPAVPPMSPGSAVPSMSPASVAPGSAASSSPEPLAPAPSTPGGTVARPCAPSPRIPERVRLVTRGGELRAVALSWTAEGDGCGTATVVLRLRGHTLRVWLREGTAPVARPGARVLPVRVDGATASTRVRLAPPLPAGAGLAAVDGRTGRPIALR
ncbi:hypothetical protein ACFOWE_04160 [Planomonospora corallina]|uniref:Uncharacterized protein n=1 Tax=Planomonospora corallina TaxID=1806052 RepID=A0ABV8HZX4_9ACTN